ncbi:hypothetical protein HPC49_28870 [Pyxidicoccus fallax]|uniref:Uncharacterized protein n=1 Tax=Pyxidicoccus fallax TaxID=394095 RepID=A0A848LT64_9BACT|nr:hypothetical protein [Pyxidicoccus fallax]NMO21125.1 hypothetical protein [Pyxidicoccus fallax]NPC82217.1 hypothetical protein [Pyxidicoccus fallax]
MMRSSPRGGVVHEKSEVSGTASEPSLERAATAATTELVDRITALVEESETASYTRKAGMAGAINMLMARLPTEANSEETATCLLRLLDEGRLDGLEDEDGEPSSVAATRALLAMGYPHAMQVPPERLEALRRREHQTIPVPWGLLVGILLPAAVIQVGFVLSSDTPHQYFGLRADCLAGDVPCPPPGFGTWFRTQGLYVISLVLGGSNILAGLVALAMGRFKRTRRQLIRNFLGVATLGVMTGVLLMALGYVGFGMSALWSAGGALAAAWALKSS